MYLVQILLPLYDNRGERFEGAVYRELRDQLVERFGGLTAYTRAPISGLWQESSGRTVRDDLVIYEVMVETLDEGWWAQYRRALELWFQQDTVVVRAQQIFML